LVRERRRASLLEREKQEIQHTMLEKLEAMEKVKNMMEKRAVATERKLEELRVQLENSIGRDETSRVNVQLEELEAAKNAFQLRAAKVGEEADTLRKQMSDVQSMNDALVNEKSKLELRLRELEPLQEKLRYATRVKDDLEKRLYDVTMKHQESLKELELSNRLLQKAKVDAQEVMDNRTKLERDLHVATKERAAVISQLRDADKHGREVEEGSMKQIEEWRAKHLHLERKVAVAAAKIEALEKQAKGYKLRLAAAAEQQTKASAAAQQFDKERSKLMSRIEELEQLGIRKQKEVDALQESIKMMKDELSEARREMEQLRDNARVEEERKVSLEHEVAELKRMRVKDDEALEKMREVEGQLQASLSNSANLSAQLKKLELDYSEAASLLNKAQTSIQEHQKTQAALQHKVKVLEEEKTELKARSESADLKANELKQQLEKSEKGRTKAMDDAKESQVKAKGLEEEISKLTRHVRTVEEVKKGLQEQSEVARREIESLQEKLRATDDRYGEAKKETAEVEKKLKTLQALSSTLNSKLNATRLQADQLKSQLRGAEQKAAALKQEVAKERSSRMDVQNELNQVRQTLLSELDKAEQMGSEWKKKFESSTTTCDELNQQLAMVAGAKEHLVTQVKGLEDEVHSLQERVTSAEGRSKAKEEEAKMLGLKVEQVRQESENNTKLEILRMKKKIRKIQMDRMKAASQLSSALRACELRDNALNDARRSIATLKQSRVSLGKQLETVTAEIVTLKRELEATKHSKDETQRAGEETKKKLEAMMKVKHTLEAKLADASGEIQQLGGKLREEVKSHAETKEEMERMRQRSELSMQELKAEVDKCKGDLEAFAKTNAELVDARENLSCRLHACEHELSECMAKKEELARSLDQVIAERDAAVLERHQAVCEVEQSKIQLDLMHREVKEMQNVTWHQWNLIDAARSQLCEVYTAKNELELQVRSASAGMKLRDQAGIESLEQQLEEIKMEKEELHKAAMKDRNDLKRLKTILMIEKVEDLQI